MIISKESEIRIGDIIRVKGIIKDWNEDKDTLYEIVKLANKSSNFKVKVIKATNDFREGQFTWSFEATVKNEYKVEKFKSNKLIKLLYART